MKPRSISRPMASAPSPSAIVVTTTVRNPDTRKSFITSSEDFPQSGSTISIPCGELLLPVFAHIVQENIPEDETGHALRLEMLHGPGHGDVVILHIAFGRQVYDIKRNADAFGLHLQ